MAKLKICVALLFAAGMVGAVTGTAWYQASAGAAPPEDKPAAAAPTEPKPGDQPPAATPTAKPAHTSAQYEEKLDKPFDFEGFENTPLAEVLEFLSDRFNLPIFLNRDAFIALGYEDPSNTKITLPKMKGMKLGQLLDRVVAQAIAAYLVRSSGIEVTTPIHAMPGEWSSLPRDQLPTGTVVFENWPLSEAMEELAETTGINIVIDPRAGDKAKRPLTVRMKNVPVDTLVQLLANMAELKAIIMDNVFYITTLENAKTLEEQPLVHRSPQQ